jgi:hypothetical protein
MGILIGFVGSLILAGVGGLFVLFIIGWSS